MEVFAKLLELIGVSIILCSVALSSARHPGDGRRTNWRDAYERYRSNLGRGILLGLELLVEPDIIATITAPLTFPSVGLLGAIIVIRTFLSFSLETKDAGPGRGRREMREDPIAASAEPQPTARLRNTG